MICGWAVTGGAILAAQAAMIERCNSEVGRVDMAGLAAARVMIHWGRMAAGTSQTVHIQMVEVGINESGRLGVTARAGPRKMRRRRRMTFVAISIPDDAVVKYRLRPA